MKLEPPSAMAVGLRKMWQLYTLISSLMYSYLQLDNFTGPEGIPGFDRDNVNTRTNG